MALLRINRLIILSAVIAMFAMHSASADIYKYEDRHGNILLTDHPMRDANFRLIWRTRTTHNSSSKSRIDTAATQRNKSRYSPLINTVARNNRLRPELLHAVVRAESSYDPRARSRTGAMGLMQLMPDTARRYGVSDSWNPEANLNGGARYLKDLLSMFQYDLKLALAAYNAGENAVKKYGNEVPPFPETQQYVIKVLAFYQKNRKAANTTASR